MDTAFLHSFLLTVDAGSMSEAARRLDLTPAAVAQQVRALERELGTPLLLRAGRTVAPTEAGHRLAERARALLREFGNLKAAVNEEDAAGELRIGAINTGLLSLLPDTLAHFSRAQPQVKVYIQSGASTDLYEAVLRGELDAAICLHPPFALPKTASWALLREEPLVVLAPARLARREAHDLLAREPFIRYDRAVGGGKQADRYLRRAGIVPQERFELGSLAAIAMMVDRGLGVSLVPDIASPLTERLKVARLPLPVKPEARRFGIVWLRASVRARQIRALLDCARASA
ncbi:MAG TPA: LysR family transcriptional regulator [Burkholderiales bacterium]|jgi:DNA-binding transcriptional LysR family regulator